MMENETLIAENVEVDMETLADAYYSESYSARFKVVEAFMAALDPEDREKLEAYKNQ